MEPWRYCEPQEAQVRLSTTLRLRFLLTPKHASFTHGKGNYDYLSAQAYLRLGLLISAAEATADLAKPCKR